MADQADTTTTTTANWRVHRAKLASGARHYPPSHPFMVEQRRLLAEALYENRIRELVASAPPLSAAQRDRLATLLRGEA